MTSLLAALLTIVAPVSVAPALAASASAKTASAPDFRALQAQNPDIYAWLYIPGTDINYPVCQSTNDVYYLTHNTQGGLDANGALYTESKYNTRTFQDPVTVIYGHNMRSGKMFGFLEETFRQGFTGRSEAIVYLPAGGNTGAGSAAAPQVREQHYELFAALPVGSSHLLYGRNFSKKSVYQTFIDEIIHARSFDSTVIRSDVPVTIDDKLLILSTCRGGGKTNERYIVVGKLKK